ncbi:MAG: glycosyltransferase family 2 protein [Chitinophagales bacterium]
MDQDDVLQRPLVAVVVLSWNGRHFMERFLPSMTSLTYQPLDIYVADNASADDTLDFLKSRYPDVKCIAIPKNEGFAKGYNTALKQIVADYYVLVNQDVELAPGFLEPLLDLMESDVNIAACQPKILSESNRNMFEHAGAGGGYIDKYGYVFCRGRLFDTIEPDEGQYNDTHEIFWASGAAMCVRAELFHRFKGFDADYFAHMEEIDLCWRWKRAGYKIMYVPESVAFHVGGGSLSQDSPFKIYLNFRNNLFMLFKNMESQDLIWKLPVRIVLENVAFFHALFNRRWKEAGAIFRADWRFYITIPLQLRKRFTNWLIYNRNRVDQSRVKKSGYYNKSIVWQFFAKGKKVFRDL